MSGKPWPAWRKALQSRLMRRRWRGGAFASRRPAAIGDAERTARSQRMKALNIRMRDDEVLKAKNVRGQKRARRTAGYRTVQSAVMKDIMSRPELRRAARWHCIAINKKPQVRKRQWAGRRRKKSTVAAESNHGVESPLISLKTARLGRPCRCQ